MTGQELADAIWKSLQNFDVMKRDRPKYIYLDIGQICRLHELAEYEYHGDEPATIHGIQVCNVDNEGFLYFSDNVYEMRT